MIYKVCLESCPDCVEVKNVINLGCSIGKKQDFFNLYLCIALYTAK